VPAVPEPDPPSVEPVPLVPPVDEPDPLTDDPDPPELPEALPEPWAQAGAASASTAAAASDSVFMEVIQVSCWLGLIARRLTGCLGRLW